MTQLRDRLDDLVADVPQRVVPDVTGAAQAGRRRRNRRRLATGAATVAMLMLFGLVTPGLAARVTQSIYADGSGAAVGQYPAQVRAPFLLRELPTAPGPLAVVAETGSSGSIGIGPHGQVWRLPGSHISDIAPSLSPDGRRLAFLAADRRFALLDLVTGTVTRFPKVGDGGNDGRGSQAPYWAAPQQPIWWSASGDELLVVGGGTRAGDDDVGGMVLSVDGGLREFPSVGYAAGWRDDDTLVFLSYDGSRIVQVNRAGEQSSSADLDNPPGTTGPGDVSQYSPALVGNRLMVALASDPEVRVLSYDVETGRQVDPEGRVLADPSCAISTSARGAWLTQPLEDGAAALVAVAGEGRIDIDPRLEAGCVLVASSAVDGEPYRSVDRRVLDTVGGWVDADLATSWPGWRWPLLAAGLGLLAVLGAAMTWVSRRRRGGRAGWQS